MITRGKEKLLNKNIKTNYDSINRTLDEFDTINTQNTIGSERDETIGDRRFTNKITSTISTEKNVYGTLKE